MRLGITGTQSTGKSTLVKALHQLPQFQHYEIATERSKYLRDQGILLNNDSTLKGQYVFMAERSLELMKENIITDRTIYDVCAFTLSAQSINDWQKRTFVELAMELKNDYDVIVYVSPEGIDIEDNGVRCIDANYRNKIDYTIKEMLIKYPPRKLIKINGPTELRIQTILTELGL